MLHVISYHPTKPAIAFDTLQEAQAAARMAEVLGHKATISNTLWSAYIPAEDAGEDECFVVSITTDDDRADDDLASEGRARLGKGRCVTLACIWYQDCKRVAHFVTPASEMKEAILAIPQGRGGFGFVYDTRGNKWYVQRTKTDVKACKIALQIHKFDGGAQ